MKFLLSLAALALLIACNASKPQSTTREDIITPMSPMPEELVGLDIPPGVMALEQAGLINKAEKELEKAIKPGAGAQDPLVIERERLRRLRRDFAQTQEQLLEKLQKDIPDLTAGELEAWRAAGQLQYILIDGQVGYFRREPSNLYRRSEEARTRRDAAVKARPAAPEGDPNTRKTAQFDLHEHVAAALDESDRSGRPYAGRMRVHATHTVILKPGIVPEGETVRCWLPFPQEYDRQRDVELISASPGKSVVAPNGTLQRTVHLEGVAPKADQPLEFRIEYTYETSAYIPSIDPTEVRPIAKGSAIHQEFTRSQPPHVDLTPEIRKLAAEIVSDEKNPYLAAEKIFHWMDANFAYVSEMEYSIITSITAKAMNQRGGDCGIHALLFIALCRASGIPARWQSGWAMRPGNENLHDWAEFYVEPYGWLPADPSFGLRKHDDPRVHTFYFGHIDQFRMIANLDFEVPFSPAKTYWRSDNIDNQRGEVEWDGGNLYYDDWSYKMVVEYDFP